MGSQLLRPDAAKKSGQETQSISVLSLADKFSSHPADVAVIDPEFHGSPLKSEKMASASSLGRLRAIVCQRKRP